jgi:hypothetical protein
MLRKGWRKRLYKPRRNNRLNTKIIIFLLEVNKKINAERGDICQNLVIADWRYASETKLEPFGWDTILHM